MVNDYEPIIFKCLRSNLFAQHQDRRQLSASQKIYWPELNNFERICSHFDLMTEDYKISIFESPRKRLLYQPTMKLKKRPKLKLLEIEKDASIARD